MLRFVSFVYCLIICLTLGMAQEGERAFNSEEKEWIQKHPRIRLAVDDSYPPFNYLSDKGVLVGYNIDMIRLLEKKIGIEIVLEGDTWPNALEAALSHKVDGIVNANPLKSRIKYLNFTQAIASFPQALICSNGDRNICSFKDLKGLRIAVKPKTIHLLLLKQKAPEASLVEVNTLFEAIEMLTCNKVDAIYDDLAPLYHLIARYHLNNVQVAFIHTDGEISGGRFGLRNDDILLLRVMNRAIGLITAEEKLVLQHRWINYEKKQDAIWLYVCIVLLLLVALLVVIWNRLLNRSVQKQTTEIRNELHERKKAEAALRESEQRFTNIVTNIPGLVFQLRIRSEEKNKFLFLSDSLNNEFGIHRELDNEDWNDLSFLHPEDKEKFYKVLSEAVSKNESWSFEGRIINSTGGTVWFRSIASPVVLEDELVYNGIFLNINKRKNAELEIAYTSETFKKIIEAISSKRDDSFFKELTLLLSEVTQADYVFIGKLEQHVSVSTIALVSNDGLIDNFSYELRYTPCENVVQEITCIYEDEVDNLFPKDELLKQMGIKGYIGTPVYDHNKEVSGLIVALYKEPLKEYKFTKSVFEIVSANVGSELERFEVQQDLKNSKEKFKQIITTLPISLAMVDFKGRVLDVNEQFVETFGYSAADVKTISDWFILAFPDEDVHLDLLSSWKRNTKEYELTGRFERIEVRILCKDGRYKDTIVDYTTTEDMQVVTFIDLTRQKQSEIEIIREKTFSEQIINSLPGVFFLCMATGDQYRLIRWNKNYESVLNVTDDDLFGRSPSRFIVTEHQEIFNRVMAEGKAGQSIELELDFDCSNGEPKPFVLHTQHFKADPYNYFLAVGFDISERRKSQKELANYRNHLELLVQERTEELAVANEELHSTNEELNTLNEQLENQKCEIETALNSLQSTQSQLVNSEKMASLGVLTAGIAHEINNPVNFITSSIMGLQNFIQSFNEIYESYESLTIDNFELKSEEISQLKEDVDFEFLSETITSTVDNITMGADRITNIVKGLKTFTSQNDKIKQPTNIRENIEATLIMLQHELKNNVELVLTYGELPLVPAFPSKLNQVFMNLLVNSIHAIETGGKIEIKTSVDSDNTYCEISITDDGSGIPEEIQHQIFEPFFTTKVVGKGTGLGLYICYNIIKNEHDGELLLESEQGSGTKAIVRLPIEFDTEK